LVQYKLNKPDIFQVMRKYNDAGVWSNAVTSVTKLKLRKVQDDWYVNWWLPLM